MQTFEPDDKRPIKIFFQDEARFGRINKVSSCWAPRQIRPVVAQHQVRQFIYAYSVVCPTTGESHSLILPCANSFAANVFFESVSREYHDYRCIIIMDNAPWHTSNLFAKHENIRFIRLPAYSPELNAAEHLWDHIREKHFNNRGFNTLDDVEDTLILSLEQVRYEKDSIRSLVGFSWATNVRLY